MGRDDDEIPMDFARDFSAHDRSDRRRERANVGGGPRGRRAVGSRAGKRRTSRRSKQSVCRRGAKEAERPFPRGSADRRFALAQAAAAGRSDFKRNRQGADRSPKRRNRYRTLAPRLPIFQRTYLRQGKIYPSGLVRK